MLDRSVHCSASWIFANSGFDELNVPALCTSLFMRWPSIASSVGRPE